MAVLEICCRVLVITQLWYTGWFVCRYGRRAILKRLADGKEE